MPLGAALLALAMALAPSLGHAVEPDEVLADKALESRARVISEGLRCLVCQNQSIDDSNAPLARDLRILVRERLKAGDSDDGVRNFIVARYGEFVLLKPPFTITTFLLWWGPFLILLAGGGAIVAGLLRRRRLDAPKPLTDEEKARLAASLDGD
jgi:cytochrome c-type biogenesis protein CcmH